MWSPQVPLWQWSRSVIKKSPNIAPHKTRDDKKLNASLDLFELSACLEDFSSEVGHCSKSLENHLVSSASSTKDVVKHLKKYIMPFMSVVAFPQLLLFKLLRHFWEQRVHTIELRTQKMNNKLMMRGRDLHYRRWALTFTKNAKGTIILSNLQATKDTFII